MQPLIKLLKSGEILFNGINVTAIYAYSKEDFNHGHFPSDIDNKSIHVALKFM